MQIAKEATKEILSILTAIDWNSVKLGMDLNGYAHVHNVLPANICDEFVLNYGRQEGYRKTVIMERHRFGLGEYKYFDYPLPQVVQTIREKFYPELAPIANDWMDKLKIEKHFPESFEELRKQCEANGQTKPTPLILKYGKGGFNTLHQDLYGDVYFPIQLAFFLNQPGENYTGGEFVLTQQVPRVQSKPIVLTPKKGDMLVFTTNFRPVSGSRGYYRAVMRHGVSEVHSGERHTLGVIFHDAIS